MKAWVKRAQKAINDVSFEAYRFVIAEGERGVYLKAEYDEEDVYTHKRAVQHTRAWILTPAMTKSEIVQTAFKCVITSMEHRAREGFLYKGARVFGPHFDIDDLWAVCQAGRENAGGRSEARSNVSQ